MPLCGTRTVRRDPRALAAVRYTQEEAGEGTAIEEESKGQLGLCRKQQGAFGDGRVAVMSRRGRGGREGVRE